MHLQAAELDWNNDKGHAIYTLLMMEHGFVAPSINLFEMDPDIAALGLPIVTETREADLKTTMSNSFGFGGTNGTVVFSKV